MALGLELPLLIVNLSWLEVATLEVQFETILLFVL